jgi:hypothetical protein
MNEQTDLALVRSEIASFIGTPEERWDARTAVDVDSAIRRGIESVIHNAASHQWSWMRPTYRFKTADGQRRYTLPLDFEQFIGDIYFDGAEYGYSSIKQLPAGRVAQMYGDYDTTGVPTNYALEVQSHDGTRQQQYQLVLHPTPNDGYSLVGPYQVGPIRSLSNERPWFPGGPEQRDLFIAACLAAAESKFMDQPQTDKQEQFQSALVAAIGRDHRKQPRNLGQMGGRRGKMRDDYRYKLGVTYLGTTDM